MALFQSSPWRRDRHHPWPQQWGRQFLFLGRGTRGVLEPNSRGVAKLGRIKQSVIPMDPSSTYGISWDIMVCIYNMYISIYIYVCWKLFRYNEMYPGIEWDKIDMYIYNSIYIKYQYIYIYMHNYTYSNTRNQLSYSMDPALPSQGL